MTEGHARALVVDGDGEPPWPTQTGAAIVIAEVDGGMVPLVEVDPDGADRRRGKRLLWKEAKLSLAHAHGSTTRVYAATLRGGVEVAGRQLLTCAIAAGLGTDSQVMPSAMGRCGSPIRFGALRHAGPLYGGLLPCLRRPRRGGRGLRSRGSQDLA